MLRLATRDAGSFRDPAGHVYEQDGQVFRTVAACAAKNWEAVRDNPVFRDLTARGWIIQTEQLDPTETAWPPEGATYLLQHPKLPFISYPYEWSFPALKAAALHHLDLHLALLSGGLTLSDASAYNVQFRGTSPIFIDVLSIRPYRAGEFWIGHKQFCEQFLNPLVLRAKLGVPHNAWFRGQLEGIPTGDLARLLPMRHKLSFNILTHIVLQDRLQNRALAEDENHGKATPERKLAPTAFSGILQQLRRWIARLEPAATRASTWGKYANHNTYASDEALGKRAFVTDFVQSIRPRVLWDLGCNTGDYSVAALEASAGSVIGWDFDQAALEQAFARAAAANLDFLPLLLDAANPSPDQGWQQAERKGLQRRAQADAVIALAFVHHLAIGRNVPLPDVVGWITGLAPAGIIEFVQKNDTTVRKMLRLREDIFPDYTEEAFLAALRSRARIVRSEIISRERRLLVAYER